MPAYKAMRCAIAAAFSSLCIVAPAMADDPESANPAATQDRLSFPTPAATSVEGLGPALDPAALDAYRGGDDRVENHVHVDGTVDGNSAQNTISGNNALGGDAFSNASGIATVIQNSGSNVLIQNGMVVNVQFGSGP